MQSPAWHAVYASLFREKHSYRAHKYRTSLKKAITTGPHQVANSITHLITSAITAAPKTNIGVPIRREAATAETLKSYATSGQELPVASFSSSTDLSSTLFTVFSSSSSATNSSHPRDFTWAFERTKNMFREKVMRWNMLYSIPDVILIPNNYVVTKSCTMKDHLWQITV